MKGFHGIIILLSTLLFNIGAMAQHANEFYINGAHVTIQSGIKLHIQGDVHLDEGGGKKGRLNVDGELELRGDFYVRSDNTEITDGNAASWPATSTGTLRFKNRGFNIETDHSDESQTIYASGATDLTGRRAFYNLELENDNSSNGSAFDNYVDINGGDVEVKNTLTFNNDSRIRTYHVKPTPINGVDYYNFLIITNPALNAISGYSTTAGDNKRYVEGKLSRQVSGSQTYYFPVGLAPGFVGADGMASFELASTSAVSQRVDARLDIASTELGIPQIYCDIGDYPDPNNGIQPWSACAGGPDGIQDFAHLNLNSSHEWVIENQGIDFSYDLEVFPGSGLDATVPSSGANCGTAFHMRFLAKDGSLMENGSVGTVINPPPPFNTTNNFPIGFDLCPPATKQLGNTLEGLSGFSHFRLHGAADNQTVLPVELVSLEANPMENRYIRLDWLTASEVNNDGFELQRSTNGVHFESITWEEGYGTSSEPHDYTFNDMAVIGGILYYYRLKQYDFDGSFEFSEIVSARLELTGEGISIYPNPVYHGDINVEFHSLGSGVMDMLLINAIGQEVNSYSIEVHEGTNLIHLSVDHLSAGTYIIRLNNGRIRFEEKIILLR